MNNMTFDTFNFNNTCEEVIRPTMQTETLNIKNRSTLPVFKVAFPPEEDGDSGTCEGDDVPKPPQSGPQWKLDRRASGSLFWRRDSVVNANSKVKFRFDVDVLEFMPREGEHIATYDDEPEEETDVYDDDYIFLHDDELNSWFPRADLFGYRRMRRNARNAKQSEATAAMSVFCVLAILLTAYVQFTFIK